LKKAKSGKIEMLLFKDLDETKENPKRSVPFKIRKDDPIY
jgi:hypothetical protein